MKIKKFNEDFSPYKNFEEELTSKKKNLKDRDNNFKHLKEITSD